MKSPELQAAVDAISWYHKMSLPDGIVTPGESDTARGLPRLRLPATVLEILAGIPAGIAGQKGYPADSIHGRVTARLDALLQKQGEFAARLDGQSPSPAAKRRNTRTG